MKFNLCIFFLNLSCILVLGEWYYNLNYFLTHQYQIKSLFFRHAISLVLDKYIYITSELLKLILFKNRIAPLMIIPFALNYFYIGLTVSLIFLAASIISTALILDHYPGSEMGIFG